MERSTELLRKALPLMSRQAAALHPVSYAVWYAYVADVNSPLHKALDAHLAEHGVLDETATEALFRRHLADPDADTATQVTDGVARLLDGMQASAAAAGDQTARYGDTLQRLSAALGPADSAPGGSPPLDEALAHTLQMQAALARLQKELAESQREIDSLRDEVRRARQESLVDALTTLANRRAFDRRLVTCLAADAAVIGRPPVGAPVCLLMIDIDHFKRVNDSYGHAFGDQVLRAVAQVLKALTPEGGLAARVGGEEFALLLPGMPLAPARALAEKLRATVAASRIRRKGGDADEHITVSLGVAQFLQRNPALGLSVDEAPADFFDRADRALYAAKQAGRDRVVVAD
ncbi:GGDEF domain-containing protein [Pseudaquabacterium pictum]|uniref:GGDEF domain-containing protein n=1 Tax=Pseudaquabacterium pictum TaxID=2315236 RepID=UPI001396A504|nr:GGDEF domain-containing protein [Rubrivivax pictus]